MQLTCAKENHSPKNKGSPEELLAAVHASCFSMALSQILTMQGNRKIDQLRVEITTTLDQIKKEEPYLITREEIYITGKVDDIDETNFIQIVEMEKSMCAVGLSLRGNVEMVYHINFIS